MNLKSKIRLNKKIKTKVKQESLNKKSESEQTEKIL